MATTKRRNPRRPQNDQIAPTSETSACTAQERDIRPTQQRADLTIQEVADYLNVSRPYVLSLIESNLLPARKVGTDYRITFENVIRFDQQDRPKRRAALDELARIDQELGLQAAP